MVHMIQQELNHHSVHVNDVDEEFCSRLLFHLGKEAAHPNILRVSEVTLEGQHVRVLMEPHDSGLLVQRLGPNGVEEKLARFFFQQIVAGLAHIGRHGSTYSGLTLTRCLLAVHNGIPIVKLQPFGEDLGYSGKTQYHYPYAAYAALEHVVRPKRMAAGKKSCTVWALGIMLYSMLTGRHPFYDMAAPPKNLKAALASMLSGLRSLRTAFPSSPDLSDLLLALLCPHRSRRPTLQQIQQHPWYLTNLPLEIRNNYTQGSGFMNLANLPPSPQTPAAAAGVLAEAVKLQLANSGAQEHEMGFQPAQQPVQQPVSQSSSHLELPQNYKGGRHVKQATAAASVETAAAVPATSGFVTTYGIGYGVPQQGSGATFDQWSAGGHISMVTQPADHQYYQPAQGASNFGYHDSSRELGSSYSGIIQGGTTYSMQQ